MRPIQDSELRKEVNLWIRKEIEDEIDYAGHTVLMPPGDLDEISKLIWKKGTQEDRNLLKRVCSKFAVSVRPDGSLRGRNLKNGQQIQILRTLIGRRPIKGIFPPGSVT